MIIRVTDSYCRCEWRVGSRERWGMMGRLVGFRLDLLNCCSLSFGILRGFCRKAHKAL